MHLGLCKADELGFLVANALVVQLAKKEEEQEGESGNFWVFLQSKFSQEKQTF